MLKQTFDNDQTYLPVTMQQFQDLTNEILTKFNELTSPHGLDGNYMAQVVHGVIHGLDRTTAVVSKSDLLDRSVNMVSKHVTYHAIQEIEARMKAEKAASQTALENPPTDNVVPFDQEAT
jgi:butyrate kinase